MARAASGVPAPRSHGGRWIALTAAATVLVVAAAVAATLALAHSGKRNGNRAAGTRASAAARASKQPGHPTTPGTTPVTALAGGRIAVAVAAARSPQARPVVSFLARYFAAINSHDYGAYRRLFSAEVRGGLSRATFIAGYGTTRDSLATLRDIGVIGPGQLAAVITFTSHQQPGQSQSQSSCTRWRISLYLTRAGNGYLLQAPPPGYRAFFRACP
ncbi:MAG: hypothetical protein ACLQFR_20540 [Streptosporangiaceae bacterium]